MKSTTKLFILYYHEICAVIIILNNLFSLVVAKIYLTSASISQNGIWRSAREPMALLRWDEGNKEQCCLNFILPRDHIIQNGAKDEVICLHGFSSKYAVTLLMENYLSRHFFFFIITFMKRAWSCYSFTAWFHISTLWIYISPWC